MSVKYIHENNANPLINYYDEHTGNYTIPVTDFANVVENVMTFLKTNRDYFLMYLSDKDGYEEDMWCVTNWIE